MDIIIGSFENIKISIRFTRHMLLMYFYILWSIQGHNNKIEKPTNTS